MPWPYARTGRHSSAPPKKTGGAAKAKPKRTSHAGGPIIFGGAEEQLGIQMSVTGFMAGLESPVVRSAVQEKIGCSVNMLRDAFAHAFLGEQQRGGNWIERQRQGMQLAIDKINQYPELTKKILFQDT